jgi:SPP1 family phage portal protein
MIQISNIEEFKEEDIPKLVTIVNQELLRREELYKRYRRKQYDYEIVGQANKDKVVVVPFEKYIVDIATGYLGGKEPTYEVEEVNDDKKKIIKKVLDKDMPDTTTKEEMEEIITYILKYNDDNNENYQLVKDIMLYGSCYEMVYQNKDNEVVYGRLDPLQTVAIWDYSIPKNLIGLVSVYKEQDVNTSIKYVVRIIDKNGTRLYRGFDKTYTQETKDKLGNGEKDNYWGDVPAIVVETEDNLSLFEPAIDLIEAYQSLIKNTKETFNYNNDAKLKITGYLPENPLMVMDEKTGLLIENEERKKEDETLLKAPVFYTPQDGDISWVEKTIDDGATQNTLKTYIDLIMMITGTPQVTDLGFEKADNASAIDRKFFTLEQMTTQAMQLLKTAYLRRWELIFNRINELKNTNYDFRNIKITLNKNLPANENEVVDMYMKLRGLISDETIIERLPLNFDSVSELQKKADQEEENMQKYMGNAQQFNQNDKQEQQTEEKQKEEEIKTEQQ